MGILLGCLLIPVAALALASGVLSTPMKLPSDYVHEWHGSITDPNGISTSIVVTLRGGSMGHVVGTTASCDEPSCSLQFVAFDSEGTAELDVVGTPHRIWVKTTNGLTLALRDSNQRSGVLTRVK
jgi:hypothetical protein